MGGQVDILGGLFYPLRKVKPDESLIINEGGKVHLSYTMNGCHNYNQ